MTFDYFLMIFWVIIRSIMLGRVRVATRIILLEGSCQDCRVFPRKKMRKINGLCTKKESLVVRLLML